MRTPRLHWQMNCGLAEGVGGSEYTYYGYRLISFGSMSFGVDKHVVCKYSWTVYHSAVTIKVTDEHISKRYRVTAHFVGRANYHRREAHCQGRIRRHR